jgi:hypothetical protein
MFDCTGLPTCDDASEVDSRGPDACDRPMEYVVCKDGKPFAVLNATPSLALRTVAGFCRSVPSASWSVGYRGAWSGPE